MPGEGFNIGVNPAAESAAPQTTQERLAAVRAEQESLKKAKAMHEAGFENGSDYDQWKLLEELRNATLSLRQQSEGAPPKRKADPFPFAA